MQVDAAKTIDTLYKQVKDYDLVLTVDPALADALNNRIDKPRLGKLAYTPRHLVYEQHQNNELLSDRDLFIKTIQQTNLDWKQASSLLNRILEAWQESGSRRALLTYDRYNSEQIKQILQIIENTTSIYTAQETLSIPNNISVAAIGLHQFNTLDKKTLPERFDDISPFHDTQTELPTFKIFNSNTDLVKAVVDNIRRINEDDVAVVVDPNSRYEHLLKAAFQSKGIDYLTSEAFDENNQMRTLLQLLRKAVTPGRLQLKDVQPFLHQHGIDISVARNEEYLARINDKALAPVNQFLQDALNATFQHVLQLYQDRFADLPQELSKTLDDLDFMDKTVTEEALNHIEYYLDTYDITLETDSGGVLLASPTNTAYIDKPVVFHLGMDAGWSKQVPNQPWINQNWREQKQIRDFKLLLQNGDQQYFMVQDVELNQEVTPCFLFTELGDEFESFTDAPHTRYGASTDESDGFAHRSIVETDIDEIKVISQSSLNRLIRCPREYFFSRLVTDIDKEFLRKGTLLHDFAEFYINHRATVKENGLDHFVDLIMDAMAPITDNLEHGLLRSEINIALDTLTTYLEREEIEHSNLDGYTRNQSDNWFADQFNQAITSTITEMWFEDPAIGGKGMVDLIKTPTELLDYKSGTSKTKKKIVSQSNVDLLENDPNVQAILYLLHHRSVRPDEELGFTFFHFLANQDDVVAGSSDLDDTLVTITYYPNTFNEMAGSKEFFDAMREGVVETNNRRKTLERMGYTSYTAFFDGRDIPHEYDKDELLDSELANEFIVYAKEAVGDYKYVRKGCRSALKKLVEYRTTNYFKEDLDRFETFLQQRLDDLNEYRRTRFPVGDSDFEKIDNRDLIMTGETL